MEQRDLNLGELFIQTQRLMQHYHMKQHRKEQPVFDIRQGQGRILALMKKVNIITQKELAEIFGIRQQSLGESLLKLEQNGYVVRKQSQEDKRAMVVEITKKGKELEFEKNDLSEIFDCLDEQEQQNLKNYLYRISERLEEILQTQQQRTNEWDRRRGFSRGENFRRGRFSEEEFQSRGYEQDRGYERGRGYERNRGYERSRGYERDRGCEQGEEYEQENFRGRFENKEL